MGVLKTGELLCSQGNQGRHLRCDPWVDIREWRADSIEQGEWHVKRKESQNREKESEPGAWQLQKWTQGRPAVFVCAVPSSRERERGASSTRGGRSGCSAQSWLDGSRAQRDSCRKTQSSGSGGTEEWFCDVHLSLWKNTVKLPDCSMTLSRNLS